jgi:hypothetical protein
MSGIDRSRSGERGSAAGVVAVLLLAVVLALAAYVAWGLLLTPHLVGVSPNPAAEKTAVLLKGSRFAPYPGGNIVLFGDQTGKVQRAGATELEVQVPDLGLPEGRQARVPVRVLVEGRVSESVELTIGLPPPPVPTPTPTPEPEATPSPEPPAPAPSEPPRPSSPAAEARPKPVPTATPGAGKLLADAETAAAAGDFGQAAQLYGQALQLEPNNAKAKTGLDTSRAAIASLARTFVLGKTQVEGAAARGDMKAFDTRDVSVRKPAEVPGRLEITASPDRVKPGDALRLQVYLQNEGGKAIKLQALSVATTADTVRQSAPQTPLVKEVAARQRALLLEISETWKPVQNVWRIEVQVTSDKGETYTNALSWK